MSPTVAARSLHNREPEPGLINLPIPLPSIPVVSPLLDPIISGQKPANPQPASPASPPPATSAAPKPAPTQSSGGGNSGGNSGNSGSSGNAGNTGNNGSTGNTGNTGGNNGNSGNSSNGASAGNAGSTGNTSTGSTGENTSDNTGTNSSSNNAPNNSTPSSANSNQGSSQPAQDGSVPGTSSAGSASASTSNSSSNVSASGVSNVENVPAGNGSSMASDTGGSASKDGLAATPSRGAAQPSGSSGTFIPGGSGSESVTDGGTTTGTSDPNSGGNGSTNPSNPTTETSQKTSKPGGISGGAIGGIVVALLIVSGVLFLFILRRRYRARRKEKQIKWVSGYVNASGSPEMGQRASIRSSWGTPIERPASTASGWMTPLPGIDEASSYDQHDITPGFAITIHEDPSPPMPAVSPIRSPSPEDSFTSLPAPPRPVKPMSSLPIRISLISTGSGNPDPFDDAYGTTPSAEETTFNQSRMSSVTFGKGKGLNVGTPSHANFPIPPSTAGSAQTAFATGGPIEYLHTPTQPVFPDSPISPTFASSTASAVYPRRASVRYPFQPSQERRDEVLVEKGDQVSVVSVYEDGWAFVQRDKDNERGLVPLNCLEIGTAV